MASHGNVVMLGLGVLLLGASGCGSDGHGGPAAIVGPSPVTSGAPARTLRLVVTNGWTNAPVPQAVVAVHGASVVTDQAGQFEVVTTSACVPATVTAPGFLERRLRCLPRDPEPRAPVTLWPVDSEDERDALEAFAFSFRRLTRVHLEEVALSPTLADRDRVFTVWQAALAKLRSATPVFNGAWLTRHETEPDNGMIVASLRSTEVCGATAVPWPFAAGGFCLGGNNMTYFGEVRLVWTDPARVATEGVALRVLLYAAGLRPHGLPGVLNATRPDDTLSAFELRTLHMMGLRDGVLWPDTEN
jgi:hypothetical protein